MEVLQSSAREQIFRGMFSMLTPVAHRDPGVLLNTKACSLPFLRALSRGKGAECLAMAGRV